MKTKVVVKVTVTDTFGSQLFRRQLPFLAWNVRGTDDAEEDAVKQSTSKAHGPLFPPK